MAVFYLIESPSSEEVFYNIRESFAIAEVQRLFGWMGWSRLVTSEAMLRQAFVDILADSELRVIHLAAHGDVAGIQLTDGTKVAWDDLVATAQNALMAKIVVLASSDSEASAALCEAMRKARMPAMLVVGTQRRVTYEESAIGWPLFYFIARRALAEGYNFRDAFQRSIQVVNGVCNSFCRYYRWDDTEKKFLRFDKAATVAYD